MSKPVAGQWYEFDGERIWFVGYGQGGVACFQRKDCDPSWIVNAHTSRFKHLPDCTGWDWQPETFPQYWTKMDPADAKVAFIKRIGLNDAIVVYCDGTETSADEWYQSNRTRLTEQQALALLDTKPVPDPDAGCWHITHDYSNSDPHHCRKPCVSGTLFCAEHQEKPNPQPAEDPEEWVEITDPEHVVRECDQVNVWKSPRESDWMTPDATLGVKVKRRPDCIFRCRRKDLPKPRRTVTVPKWLVVYGDGKVGVYETDSKPRVDSVHKEVHRVGETTYEIEEA